MNSTHITEAIQKLHGTARDLQSDIDMLATATGNDEADKELQDTYMAMLTVLRHIRNAKKIIQAQ